MPDLNGSGPLPPSHVLARQHRAASTPDTAPPGATPMAHDDFMAKYKAKYSDPEPPKCLDSDSQGADSAQDPPRDSPPGDEGPQRFEDAHIGEWIAETHLKGKFVHTGVDGWMKFDGRTQLPYPRGQELVGPQAGGQIEQIGMRLGCFIRTHRTPVFVPPKDVGRTRRATRSARKSSAPVITAGRSRRNSVTWLVMISPACRVCAPAAARICRLVFRGHPWMKRCRR